MLLAQLWLRVVYINFMSGDPPDSDNNPYFSILGETRSIYRELELFKPRCSWNQRFSGPEVSRESRQ